MHALLPLAPPQLSQPIGVSADALDAAFLSTGDSSPRGSLSLAALGAPPGCFGACNNAGECKEGVCKCAATGSESYDCAQHATSWRPSPPVVAGAAGPDAPMADVAEAAAAPPSRQSILQRLELGRAEVRELIRVHSEQWTESSGAA